MATQNWQLKADTLKPGLDKAVKHLQTCDSYTTTESTEALKTLREASNQIHLQAALGEHLAKIDYAKLLIPMYKSLKEACGERKSGKKDKKQATLNLFNMMTAFAQFTAESVPLCAELQSANTLPYLIAVIQKAVLPLDRLDKDSQQEVTLILEILYHCIRHCGELRTLYKKHNVIPLLTKFLDTSETMIKTTSLIILAYVVDETESDKLATTGTDGCVNFLIHRLKGALHSRIHRAGGFTAAGLLEGMIHLMASDANKVKVMQQGVLPLILRMLKRKEKVAFSEEEQVLAATALWKLAFIDSNRQALKKDPDVVEALNDFKPSRNAALRETCCGALWEIYEGQVRIEEEETRYRESPGEDDATPKKRGATTPMSKKQSVREVTGKESKSHIMISYQWDSQGLMVQVKNALQNAGYNVWMDVEKMEGNILAAMANAVEKADVVLVAMSHKYKESNNCRTEASYAYKMKKSIVPLLVEKHYDPDGWLGALVGMLLYYEVNNKKTLAKQLSPIIKELGDRGRDGAALHPTDTAKSSTPDTTEDKAHEQKSQSADTKTLCSDWPCEQVQQWLVDNELSQLQNGMKSYDGKCLAQMQKLSAKCPEYFYNALKTELQLDLHAVIKLSIALDKLSL